MRYLALHTIDSAGAKYLKGHDTLSSSTIDTSTPEKNHVRGEKRMDAA